MVGQRLEEIFTDRFEVLAFRRPRHRKALQGKVSVSNIAFGLRYILRSAARLVALRPRVVYIDLPKDAVSFIRTSPVLLVAFALRIRVIGDLAGADFQFLDGRSAIERYGRWILRRVYVIRVLGPSVVATLHKRGLSNVTVVSNGIPDPSGERRKLRSSRRRPPALRREDRRGEGHSHTPRGCPVLEHRAPGDVARRG